jgi:hypothetical protein
MKAVKTIPRGQCRKQDRYEVVTGVQLQLLMSDDQTVPAMSTSGQIIEISEKGLRVHLVDLPAEVYKKLLKGLKRVRIGMDDPLQGGQLRLYGEIRWIDYHDTSGSEDPDECYLGILFDEKENIGLEAYHELMRAVKKLSAEYVDDADLKE